MTEHHHVWSIGSWSHDHGGVLNTNRIAYVFLPKSEIGDAAITDSVQLLTHAATRVCNGWVGDAHGYTANGGCSGSFSSGLAAAMTFAPVTIGSFPSGRLPEGVYTESTGHPDIVWYKGLDHRISGTVAGTPAGLYKYIRIPGIRFTRSYAVPVSRVGWNDEVWALNGGIEQNTDG